MKALFVKHYNLPGNITFSKLKWIQDNEPEIFEKIDKIMLPGDYIAYRMTGEVGTSMTGLSEGIMWDFHSGRPSYELLKTFQVPTERSEERRVGKECRVG